MKKTISILFTIFLFLVISTSAFAEKGKASADAALGLGFNTAGDVREYYFNNDASVLGTFVFNGWYGLKDKIDVGGQFGFVGSIPWVPFMVQGRYFIKNKIYAGAGLGIMFGRYGGFALNFFGGYMHPLGKKLKLDIGLNNYIKTDSVGTWIINPRVGIAYSF